MNRRRIIRFFLVVLVVFASIWLFISYLKYNVEYYQLFRDQRELFEAIIDEVESIEDSKLEFESDRGLILLYYGSNLFHDEVPQSLQDKIKKVKEISRGKFSQLRYEESNRNILIIFTFDWERDYGNTYNIVYSKNRDAVESYYSDNDLQYNLIKLDDDWYGTRISYGGMYPY